MEDVIFAFAPNGGFYYQSATHRNWSTLETSDMISPLWPRFKSLAFGSLKSSSFISFYTNLWHSNVPSDLSAWLLDRKENVDPLRRDTKVALGPNGSFFAWNSKSMRWSNLPSGLEESIQGWLGPKGWKSGPPSIVTLGYDGSYYARTTGGSFTYHIPTEQAEMSRKWADIKEAVKDLGELEYVAFNPFRKNEFVVIRRDNKYDYIVPDPVQAFLDVADSISNPERVAARIKDRKRLAAAELEQQARRLREEDDEQKASKKEKAKQKQAEKEARKKKAKEEARKTRDKEEAEEKKHEETFRQQQYTHWKIVCDEGFLKDAQMTTFPHPPTAICNCTEISCVARKTEGSLMACCHDVERLLRGSGKYSYSWLKTESFPWHPDRFGRKCHPDFKEPLIRRATEMFASLGVVGGGEGLEKASSKDHSRSLNSPRKREGDLWPT